MTRVIIHAACTGLLLMVVPAAAQGDGGPILDFDLDEINTPGHPLHPGVTYEFAPVSALDAEAPGVAVADFNADGYQDMLFPAIEGRPNHLYVNDGDGTFTEAAAAHGVAEPTKRRGMAAFFDLDNDGDLDLLTCGYPSFPVVNLDLYSMFRNDGPPSYTFTNITASVGGFALAPSLETTTRGDPGGVAVGDYDNDGYLDAVVTYWHRHAPPPSSQDQMRLWKNVPNPHPDLGQPDYTPRLLVDATVEAGLIGLGVGWVWMPSFVDVDRDGLLDLHVNIEVGPDDLRLNQGDGTFGPNIATGIGMNYNGPNFPAGPWGHEMGVGCADYDNDLDLDFYLTNTATGILGKADAFYRNDSDLSLGGGGLAFQHIGPVTTDADTTGIGWGACFADMDNDGDKDLLSARGLGAPSTNHLHLNLYPALASDGVSTALVEVGDQVPDFSRVGGTPDLMRALATFDFDNDGDLDVVATRTGVPPLDPSDNLRAGFFLNTLDNDHEFLHLSLRETGGSLNTVGARAYVRTGGAGGLVQVREVVAGSSFLAQEGDRLHFGLGPTTADWVAIRWFDGGHSVVQATVLDDPLAGFLTVDRTGPDATGDLDGDGSTDCDDVQLFVLAQIGAALVDALHPDWPWRIVADIDGNDLLDARDYVLLRDMIGEVFCDLGAGLAGTPGTPSLVGSGPLTPGSTVQLDLTNALPGSNAWLVVGLSTLVATFKGGTLVPYPDIVLGPFPTSAGGALLIGGPWPAGLPAGFQVVFQYWISDGGAPVGFAGSNAVSARSP